MMNIQMPSRLLSVTFATLLHVTNVCRTDLKKKNYKLIFEYISAYLSVLQAEAYRRVAAAVVRRLAKQVK